jgi:disease resistance protein RPM1|nr:disease resistance protein RPM1 isoform X1 [Oryza sativa Japonica Group]
MAESVVFGILCKIGSILGSHLTQALVSHLGKEVSVLIEVESIVKQIRSEFRLMQSFLQDGQEKESSSRQAETFLQEVQQIAFEVEDILDEFVYYFGRKETPSVELLKNFFRKSESVMPLRRIAAELKEVQNRLQNIRNLKLQYNIDLSEESASSIRYEDSKGHTLHHIMHNKKLVGFVNERQKLQELLMANERSCSIISIWGMGGSGKTTLVKTVSESKASKNRFDCQIWVTVSQTYDITEIMRKIIQCALKDTCSADLGSMSSEGVVLMLQETLQGRTYMMVLDDVWDTNVWFSLEGFLDESSIRSKVVITTRINDVASLAEDKRRLQLRGLDEAESWDLFCMWAFRHGEDQTCPPAMDRVARQIVGRCEGLPLAITAVGNLLSFKRLDLMEWEKFYNQLNWELHNRLDNQGLSMVTRLLGLSYKHLPVHLKNCFLLCSIFPEDYMIRGKRLCKLLVVEGLVEPRKNMTLEEIAMEYIEKLVDRCLLQVARRNKLGRVWELQMHDIIRELAISISEKEGFCMIHNKAQRSVVECEPRRLSIHENSVRVQLSINASRVRSFYQFDIDCSSVSKVQWVSRTARYLKVLELGSVPIRKLPRDIGNLFNLHYLGLRRTKIKQLPESIDRLQNLRTLDIFLTEIASLPRGVTRLRMLRHLIAGKAVASYFGLEDVFTGVKVPNGLWRSLDLNVLTGISASSNLVEQLASFTQLRSLKLTDVKNIHYTKLFASIRKMQLLKNLLIGTANSDEYVSLEALDPAPQNLEILFVKGRLHDRVIGSDLFEANRLTLMELTLENSRLSIDPLPSLSNFCNLTLLGLFNHYIGETLLFQAEWFPKLHTLTLAELQNVSSIVIEKHSMPNLYNFALICLTNLEDLPEGMEFLGSVEELSLVGMHQKFMEHVQGSSNVKVKHIPVVDYFDQTKGRWDRLSPLYFEGESKTCPQPVQHRVDAFF